MELAVRFRFRAEVVRLLDHVGTHLGGVKGDMRAGGPRTIRPGYRAFNLSGAGAE